MTINIAFKAFLVWFGILVLAIVNGILREAFLIPGLGETPGLILSGVLLSLFIFFMTYFTLPWIGKLKMNEYAYIGIGWLFLTLTFEFTFGLLQGKSWAELFDAYTFEGGNIWPIVLLVTTLSPYLSAKIRGSLLEKQA